MIIEEQDNLERVNVILTLLESAVERQSLLEPIEASLAAGPRTRASLINDILFDMAEKSLPSGGDIVVGKSKGQRHFVLPNCMVRVHWSSLRSFELTTNRNDQTADWECSDRQMVLLDSIDPDNKFWLPYVLDESYSQITHAAIGLYRDGKPKELREIDLPSRITEDTAEVLTPISSAIARRPLVLKPAAKQTILEVPLDGTDQ